MKRSINSTEVKTIAFLHIGNTNCKTWKHYY